MRLAPIDSSPNFRGGRKASIRRRQIQPDVVAGGVVEILVDAQVSLGSRQRSVAERKLDLIEPGAALVGQLRVGAATRPGAAI